MKLPLAFFILSIAGLSFLYGVVVGVYEVFPYKALKFTLNSVETVLAEKDNLLGDRPTGFLAEVRYDGDEVTVFDRELATPGLTLLTGFFEELPGLRLVRLDGSIVADWPVSYLELFPDSSHIFPQEDIPATNWNAAVHGMHLLPDGSVVFNFDGKGTVKLDRCGKPVWTLPRMTHHSIDQSADGSYWIPSRHYTQDVAAYPHFKVPYRDDTILRVSADGEVISEISVNEIIIANGLYSLLVANGRFRVDMQEDDVLHVNDIEELEAGLAAQFPLFDAGDLVLSFRHLNMLMVVSPGDWTVKWYQSGPWLRQHDPDFQPDGSITVYNNNSDDTKIGDVFEGSNIMSLLPSAPDRKVDIIYGDEPGEEFFTNTQGKHQRFANGNLLIAEYYGGRALEVSPGGDIVWEYINRYDDEAVAKVSGAARYPEDYFTVADWSCDAG